MEPGIVIWFTGVPASGKSTLAAAVQKRLEAMGLPVENLDADEVRAHISPDLKYTEADRDMNTLRLAYLAHLLSRNGVTVLVAAVSSLRRYRDRAREMCGASFVEVWVRCPVDVCRQRDPKGLYARADRGEVSDIAGVHQPYEEPGVPELVLDTDAANVGECANAVLAKLLEAEETQWVEAGEAEAIKARLRELGYL